jgi:hypothetical protein
MAERVISLVLKVGVFLKNFIIDKPKVMSLFNAHLVLGKIQQRDCLCLNDNGE